MNGIRFYEEFTDKSKRQPCGTVVAALVLNGSYRSSGTICYEAIAAVLIGQMLRLLERGWPTITCARSASVSAKPKPAPFTRSYLKG